MNLNDLLSALKKTNNSTETPEGLCPNCWGRQEYGKHFYEAAKNNNVSIDQVDHKKGWIQDYADKHLYKIALVEKGSEVVCNNCKITYKPSEL